MKVYCGKVSVAGSEWPLVDGWSQEKQQVAAVLLQLPSPEAGELQWVAYINRNGCPGATTITICADKKTPNMVVAKHQVVVVLPDGQDSKQIEAAIISKLLEYWQAEVDKLQQAAQIVAVLQSTGGLYLTASGKVAELLASLRSAFPALFFEIKRKLRRIVSRLGLGSCLSSKKY